MYVITINEAVLALLREHAILHARSGERWRAGDRLAVNGQARIESYCEILGGTVLPHGFGAFSYTMGPLEPHVRVGRYCSLARYIQWMDTDHPMDWASSSPAFYDSGLAVSARFRQARNMKAALPKLPKVDRTVTVGNDVWIGDGAMVAPGVTIGDGAVIGARSLVLKDVPPYAVMVGHPARVLRYRFPEALVGRFLALKWWRFGPDVLQDLGMDQPERFLDRLEARIAAGEARALPDTAVTVADIFQAATGAPLPASLAKRANP